ncbi:2OG-Fe(II) oxygenase [Patescibacteria group bacterium]|nr:2OG-Fe(II) oxygenase [Patescibacteria group bacterium]
MRKPIKLDILQWIRVQRKYLPPLRLGVISLRIDRSWTEISQYGMKYLATELIVRWPRFLMIRLDLANYHVGGFLEPHIDPTFEEVRQYNSILVLKSPEVGGELISEKFVYNSKYLKIIEPNRYQHEVTKITQGERLVLNLSLRFSFEKLPSPPF